jgi:tRNA G10  N-methylase Trm11
MSPIFTCKQGTNADLFPDILELYVPKGSMILDATYGRGVFWRKVKQDDYKLIKNDINEKFKGINCSWDCRKLPVVWEKWFDAVIIDLPYLYVGGFKTLRYSLDAGYQNKERAVDQGIYGVKAVDQMHYDAMKEAYRVLKPKGILILKCMDQVQSGENRLAHVVYTLYAESLGFKIQDLFVLMRDGQPLMRHKREEQKHARKNHSYFLVCEKMQSVRRRHFIEG